MACKKMRPKLVTRTSYLQRWRNFLANSRYRQILDLYNLFDLYSANTTDFLFWKIFNVRKG
jgi:hypothetical protein